MGSLCIWGKNFSSPSLYHLQIFFQRLADLTTLFNIWVIHFSFFNFLQIYCCLGALAIADSLHHVNADMLGWWLCERQLPSGGLNGEFQRVSKISACHIGLFWVAFCLCVKTRHCKNYSCTNVSSRRPWDNWVLSTGLIINNYSLKLRWIVAEYLPSPKRRGKYSATIHRDWEE